MNSASLRRPLSDAEMDRLETFLATTRPSGMTLEMVDGYFTALICGPDMVMPSEYLPEIWGDDFAFSNDEQAREIIGLLMRHWNTITAEFRSEPHVHEPILFEDENGVAHGNDWAQGFLRGTWHRPDGWRELIGSEEHGGPMVPIMMSAYENDPDPSMRPPPIPDAEREDLLLMMIVGASRIWQYFKPHRRAFRQPPPAAQRTKTGRNEPCPCGSGRKYKRCCGAAASIVH